LEALREEMRELMGALREASRVTVELRYEMSGLNAKLNMVALAQLAGEAKGIAHDVAIKEHGDRIASLFDLLTAAE